MPVNSTFSARLILASTTLFPNPANSDVTATEVVSGSTEFSTVVVPASTTTTFYGPSAGAIGSSDTLYLYAGSPTTNPATMSIFMTGSNISSSIGVLRPGDFLYLPVKVNAAGIEFKAINTSATSSTLNVFWGER